MDRTEETDVQVSQKLLQYAREGKQFMIESGEEVIRDELIMRAAVTYGLLVRRGFVAPVADENERVFARAHTICLIAAGFHDAEPSTPVRAKLFAHRVSVNGVEGEAEPDFEAAASTAAWSWYWRRAKFAASVADFEDIPTWPRCLGWTDEDLIAAEGWATEVLRV